MKRYLERGVKYIPVFVLAVAVCSLGYWLLADPSRNFVASVPQNDSANASASAAENIKIGAFFECFAQESSDLKDTWTRFRGSNSDNIKISNKPLIENFAGKQPPLMWSVELGEGHSGAAIYDGLVYMLDYDEKQKADMLRCFSLVSGKEQWRRWYTVQVKRNHGMSRTVPAITDKFILTIGPRGHVMCVDRLSGDFKWGLDLTKKYQTEIPLWYTGQCPLIVNEVAILGVGGKSLLIGVDCNTGKVVWETPNPDEWKMAHSSVMPYTYNGRNMFVYSAVGGVVGVAADGSDAGTVLWKSAAWNKSVVAPSPVCMPDGKIFLTAGYGAGSMLLQLKAQGGTYSVDVLKRIKPGDGLSSEQQTPILLDGCMIGIMPKDAKALRNQLVCVKASDPTQVIWSSGSSSKFGLGPYILADDKFYILNDDATLIVAKKSLKGYQELDRVKLFDGQDAWAPLAIADGYMVLRDSKRMVCIDLNKK
jgi:outer membrane protein assembly factor BamB